MRENRGARILTRALLGLAAALPAAGCIQIAPEQSTAVRRHALDVVPVAAPEGAAGALPTLAVREFTARRRYDARVVRRGTAGELTFLEFDRWVEEPAEAVTTVVREELARSGAFHGVTSAGAAFETALVLEGVLLAFDVIVGADGSETARVEMRLDLAGTTHGDLVHSGRFVAERPVAKVPGGGIGPAMSACVADAVRDALAAWAAAR